MSSGGFYGGYSGYGGGGGSTGNGGYNNGAGNNYSQYPNASSSQQQQQYQQQPQYSQQKPQQQQTAPEPMNFWNPTTAMAAAQAFSGNSPDSQVMFGMAESMGKQFLETSWAKAVPGLERSMVALRPYFAVDNAYVKSKMGRVLFPFVYKDWARQEKDPAGPDSPRTFALPLHDINAPDLYIPTMSLLTYVLLCALCYGTAGKFNPEVLPDVTSKCIMFQILEVIAIRIGFYFMEAPVAMMDLLSYTGYKYLGLSVNMLSGVALGHFGGYGHRAYYFTYLWTATAVSYFILKVMANTIPRITSAAGPKRQFMVLGFAGSQFATCWFVSQTKFLN